MNYIRSTHCVRNLTSVQLINPKLAIMTQKAQKVAVILKEFRGIKCPI